MADKVRGSSGSIKVWKLMDHPIKEIHSIESTKPDQMMQLGNNKGLNCAQLTSLVQLGAESRSQV
jgi:hypothetical protein